MVSYLNKLNTQKQIVDINDPQFLPYGRIVKGYDFGEWITFMEEKSEMPMEFNIYYPSIEAMEKTAISKTIQQVMYGAMDIQVGYCNGKNSSLNGLEYHKGNELFIAVTDLVVFFGQMQDIHNNTYETAKVKAFFVPKGMCLEVYATTLHSAPCKTSAEGFKSIVVLPKNTNCLFQEGSLKEDTKKQLDPESTLLFRVNKWLLVHGEHSRMVAQGAYQGLIGENYTIQF